MPSSACSPRAGTLYVFPTRRSSDLGEHFLAFEDWLRSGPEAQPAIGIGTQRITRDQRSGDWLNQRHFLRLGNAENRQAMMAEAAHLDRKSTRLNSSHANISYAVFCL